MSRPPRRLSIALWLAFACGCQSDARRASQAQVLALAERVERLRRADNADKRQLLEALRSAECASTEACALKDLCVRAYQLHQNALDSIQRLKQLSEQAGAPAPADTQAQLGEAQQALEQAKDLSQQCAEQQVRVVRKSLL
jgi:hypothetical protein